MSAPVSINLSTASAHMIDRARAIERFLPVLEYGFALDPSYHDMVKRTWTICSGFSRHASPRHIFCRYVNFSTTLCPTTPFSGNAGIGISAKCRFQTQIPSSPSSGSGPVA